MTLDEFRIKHSLLIEHYQHIEFNLKGILSSINDGKEFLDGMDEVEKDTIRRVINGIKAKQKSRDEVVLSVEECNQLKHISERRNYWCHQCYIEMAFDRDTGDPKKKPQIDALLRDLMEAERMRAHLFDKKIPLLEKKVRGK